MRAWFTASLRRVSGRSDIAGAIRYALSRWHALTRYQDDGTLAIDNNAAERAIRPLVPGRKNWLFAGSDAGGERAAAIYSLERDEFTRVYILGWRSSWRIRLL